MEYIIFNKKGKVESIMENIVKVINESEGEIEVEVSIIFKDKKGKEFYFGIYQVFCKDGKLFMDVNFMFNLVM